jgi:hypothetical protein
MGHKKELLENQEGYTIMAVNGTNKSNGSIVELILKWAVVIGFIITIAAILLRSDIFVFVGMGLVIGVILLMIVAWVILGMWKGLFKPTIDIIRRDKK